MSESVGSPSVSDLPCELSKCAGAGRSGDPIDGPSCPTTPKPAGSHLENVAVESVGEMKRPGFERIGREGFKETERGKGDVYSRADLARS